MKGPSREDVSFASHGATLRGWLYRPTHTGEGPGVVMAHGFTAVREMYLDRYAEGFAAAGLTTLVYDHFGFGASDGEPRQYPGASIQLAGYRDAVTWLGHQPTVDAGRIGIWGTSHSGGHVIALAAEELPIRCAVAQVPGIGVGAPGLSHATLEAINRAAAEHRPEATVPAVADSRDGLGIMFDDDAHGWFTRVAAERSPSWRNEVRISALSDLIRPIDHLPHARVPLLLIVAPADRLTPPAAAIEAASTIPTVEVAKIPGGHFDVYEDGLAASSAEATAWFRRFLLA